jgi:hypothetical protein
VPRPALPGGPVSQSRGSASNIGRHGRVGILATRDDSELSWVAVEDNGDILGLTLGGNMGACDVTVNVFMPDGSPVPFFQRQFAASLEHAGPPVFVAVFIVRRSGFLPVGTGQSVPVTPAPSPTAIGQAVAFEPDGSLDMGFAHHGVARFSSRMENPVWALTPAKRWGPDCRPDALPASRCEDTGVLDLLGMSNYGSVEAGYSHGPEHLELPFLGQSLPASEIPVSIATISPRKLLATLTALPRAV